MGRPFRDRPISQQQSVVSQQLSSSQHPTGIGVLIEFLLYRSPSMYLGKPIDICQYVFVELPVVACCTPILEERLSPADAADLATRFKALSDPARLRLLSLIASCGEVCACELVDAVGVSQPTVSHHLKVLHAAGLLERERRGKWVHYRVASQAFEELRAVLR
jgi:ArsR family transcriptional regulator